MSKSILPLISLWEDFSTTNKRSDVKSFARWLLQNDIVAPEKNNSGLKIEITIASVTSELDEPARVMFLIARIHRLMQRIAKPVIKKLGFTKEHEYSMLTHIYLLKTPNKKQVAEKMLLENTTAVEISNRLLKKGYISEIKKEGDKRSTLICLTALGEQKLLESYVQLKDLPAQFLDILNEMELKSLLMILQKIENSK
ncbi:MAG: hypothetical protein JWR05_787 [Mucilaginibacter sp.]|nr:hypothetical protein [Mucilaginibacter sp.]